jgi:uncharacterized membrane protein (UPF0127 family)
MIKTLSLLSTVLFLLSAPAFAEPLQFETQAGKTISFDVEVAKTDEEKKNGLMNRDSLKPNTGMLFVFDPPTKPVFWMKDAKIHLDMIYIGEDGIVTGIHENAVPFDQTKIFPPEVKTKGVVEITGGDAKKLGISKGDKVIHTIFKKEVK